MPVEDNVTPESSTQLAETARYRERRAEIAAWNAREPDPQARHRADAGQVRHLFHRHALQPGRRAGASSTPTARVLLNHGGTEMGQGLYTKVAQVVAHELGVTLDRVRVSAADTTKVPNTSATAASSGSDLNGMAAQAAARTIQRAARGVRRADISACPPPTVRFAGNSVHVGEHDMRTSPSSLQFAYRARVSLSATGFYAHAEDPLGPQDAFRAAVFLFRVRRRGVGGRRSTR